MIELELAKISYRFVKKLSSPISGLFTANALNHNYTLERRMTRGGPITVQVYLIRVSSIGPSQFEAILRDSTKFETLKKLIHEI